jgi:hypothetical protein
MSGIYRPGTIDLMTLSAALRAAGPREPPAVGVTTLARAFQKGTSGSHAFHQDHHPHPALA